MSAFHHESGIYRGDTFLLADPSSYRTSDPECGGPDKRTSPPKRSFADKWGLRHKKDHIPRCLLDDNPRLNTSSKYDHRARRSSGSDYRRPPVQIQTGP